MAFYHHCVLRSVITQTVYDDFIKKGDMPHHVRVATSPEHFCDFGSGGGSICLRPWVNLRLPIPVNKCWLSSVVNSDRGLDFCTVNGRGSDFVKLILVGDALRWQLHPQSPKIT